MDRVFSICIFLLTGYINILNVKSSTLIPTGENFLFGTTRSSFIWFQHGTKNWTELQQTPSTTAINFTQNFFGVYGTSYLYRRNYLVYSDTGVKSIFFSDIAKNNTHVFAYIGTSSSVGHLAVDWMSGNVYWCDGAFGWIGMLALPQTIENAAANDKFKVVIDKYLDIPSGIAVQPSHEWIFWTDIGVQPKIERSALDGTERNVLVLHGIIKPISITIDTLHNNIVWTDPVRGTIEYCDFYGNHRAVLRTDSNSMYYGIEIWKNYVYISEQSKNEILVFSATNGQELSTPYKPGGLNVSSISLFSADNQYVNNDACSSKGCDHICLTTNSAAKCTCEDGYELAIDGKQCTAQSTVLERSILYSNSSRICAISITYINTYKHFDQKPDCRVGGSSAGDITHITLRVDNDEVYYSVDKTIYRQKFFQSRTVLTVAPKQITGISFDWITKELYWTVFEDNNIHKAVLPSDESSRFGSISEAITTLDNPTYIAINPLERLMFAITGKDSKKIEAISLNNASSTVLENTRLTEPKWLTYYRPKDRLYWTDINKIGSISSTGQGIKIHDTQGISNLHGVTLYKDYVLWIQSTNTETKVYVDETSSDDMTYSFTLQNMGEPNGIVVYDRNIQPQSNVPCVKDNGGCKQICVVYGVFPKCECYIGYKLQSDERTCIAETFETDYYLTIDKLSKSILMVKSSDTIGTIDTGAINPIAVTVDHKRSSVIWVDETGHSIKSVYFNGTSEKTLTTDSYISTIAIDASTGNIYYTTKDKIRVFSQRDFTKRSLISGLSNPKHIVLHSKKGMMVWVDGSNQPSIKQAFMDGSNTGLVVSFAASRILSPSDLVIDIAENRLIWSDNVLDKIETVSLSNTGDIKTLVSNTKEYPVAIDVDEQYVYYIGNDQRSAKRINKQDGTSATTVFSSLLFGRLTTIERITSTVLSEHLLCKENNGQCSRLCLPRGDNQRTCQCQDGVNIKDDGTTCIGDIQCQENFGAVEVEQLCTRYPSVVCGYSCNSGYSKNSNISTITCLQNGEWNRPSDTICTQIFCPDVIKNGQLENGCLRKSGSVCGYSCHDGYVGNSDSLVCHESGQWNVVCKLDTDGNKLCTGVIIGLICGGILLLVIVVIAVYCYQRRQNSKKTHNNQFSVMYDASKNGYLTSSSEKQYEEIYSEILDNIKYEKPQEHFKEFGQSTSSTSSYRYSRWPEDQLNPPPDYIDAVGGANGNSPNLNTRSEHNLEETPDNPYITACGNDNRGFDDDGYIKPDSSVRERPGIDNNLQL